MTASVQQDALLGKFAVLAYADPATVQGRLATDPSFSGWTRFLEPEIQGAFAAYAFRNTATNQVVIAYRGTDGLGDAAVDTAIAFGRWSSQFDLAMSFANTVKLATPGGAPNILVRQ